MQLEERHRIEIDALKQRLDREYIQLLQQFEKELRKVHETHQSELDKRSKVNEEAERKLRKKILAGQDATMKSFVAHQKREYKAAKERLRADAKMSMADKRSIEAHVTARKAQLQREQTDAEQRLVRDHQRQLELELRKLRRTRIIQYHLLEQELLRDELNARYRQLESAHCLLRRHHEQTRNVEERHLDESQKMRTEHLRAQHSTEEQNQQEYTTRATEDLRKRHAVQSRNHPKELKVKEAQIRKQFRSAMKTQAMQVKLLDKRLRDTLARDEYREASARLREEQKRKTALLGEQYETSIAHMLESQTVSLETWQEEEQRTLRERLTKEYEILLGYQSHQRKEIAEQHKHEARTLTDKIAARKAHNDEQQAAEAATFERERNQKLEALKSRENDELHTFDEHSTRLGFTLLALTSTPPPSSTFSAHLIGSLCESRLGNYADIYSAQRQRLDRLLVVGAQPERPSSLLVERGRQQSVAVQCAPAAAGAECRL